LVVNIVPETISPGDTAQIIPKLKNPDGSLSDFPIEQTFEIGMLDGCALGMIKTATDSGVYVDAALQPFYFIADTGAVEGTVKLRVGVIEGISSSSILKNNVMSKKSKNQQRKSIAIENIRETQSLIDGGVIGEYCFLGDLYSVVTGDANVVVENGCDYPPYDPNLYALNYELIRHDNYYPWVYDDDAQFPITTLIDVCDFPDVNQSGGSKPVFYSRIRKNQFGSYVNSWDIQPLIDGEDKLHFTIIDPTTKVNTSLKFDFVTGVCYNKINPPSQEPKVLIYNLADISNSQIIPNRDQALQAMDDFCGHHCYPQEIFKYKLIDIINLHEGEHMNDYRDSCLIPKFQNLADKIKDITLVCNSYNEEGKKNQIALIKYLIKEFIRDAISHFDQVNILATKNDYTYEKKLQRRPSIVNCITDYTDRLKSEFNISVPANCKTCP
jgi:hypothetical protein